MSDFEKCLNQLQLDLISLVEGRITVFHTVDMLFGNSILFALYGIFHSDKYK